MIWASVLTANGDLIAGGSFNTAGGQTVNGIARWDGSAWQPYFREALETRRLTR